MDKKTLSQYGWIVILVLVLSVFLAMATPFGRYIGKGVSNLAVSMIKANDNAVDKNNIEQMGKEWDDYLNNSSDDVIVPQGNAIPKGGTYYVGSTSTKLGEYAGATAIYTSGQAFPEVINDGDIYVYGDYEYRYNKYYNSGTWSNATYQNGWGVRVLDASKTEYGTILENINEKPITALSKTFEECANLVTAPIIPNNVRFMDYTFHKCTSLVNAPKIPDTIGNMTATFKGCKSLLNIPDLDNCTRLKDMYMTFSSCEVLTTAPLLPKSLTAMKSTFSNCTSLINVPIIPSSVTDMSNTFSDCTSLIDLSNFAIPQDIKNMTCTFSGCSSLFVAPNLINCTKLTDMSSTFFGCKALVNPPVIPNSVTNMNSTFRYCSSLTGTIEINTPNLSVYTNCFAGTLQKIILTGTYSKLAEIAATGNSGNVTVQ